MRVSSSLVSLVFQFAIILSVIGYGFLFMNQEVILSTDYGAYVVGARVVAGKNRHLLYDVPTQLSTFSEAVGVDTEEVEEFALYKNPPIVALLFAPLANLNFINSFKTFFIINIFQIFLIIYLLTKEFKDLDWKIVGLIVILFMPLLVSVLVGQISTFLLFLWILIYRNLKLGKSTLVGFLSALLFIKPQYFIAIPFIFMLANQKKKYVISLLAAITLLSVISVLIVGWQTMLSYPRFLLSTESALYGSDPLSQIGITSLFHNLSFNKFFPSGVWMANLILYLFFLMLFVARLKKATITEAFSAMTFFSLTFAVHVWDYDLVLTLIPLLYLITRIKTLRFSDQKIKDWIFICLIYSLWTVRFIASPYFVSIFLLLSGLHFLYLKTLYSSIRDGVSDSTDEAIT